MSQSDDISAFVTAWARDMVLSGRARHIRQASGVTVGELAKAAGCTPEQIGLFEAGRATPTKNQALQWLGHLLERASWREAAGTEAAS